MFSLAHATCSGCLGDLSALEGLVGSPLIVPAEKNRNKRAHTCTTWTWTWGWTCVRVRQQIWRRHKGEERWTELCGDSRVTYSALAVAAIGPGARASSNNTLSSN